MSVVNSLIKTDYQGESCTLFKYKADLFTSLLKGDNGISMLEGFIEQEKDSKTQLQFGVECTARGYTKYIGDYDYVASKWVKPDSKLNSTSNVFAMI